ncbi:MAG TPA: hypothetical protein VIY53_15540 [Acidobacteriaceae bacterium]
MNPQVATNPQPAADAAPAHAGRYGLGIACALAAGAWLGAAEAPARLVASGFSPFAISFCMVGGVFLARWTLPIALKGTNSVVRDLRWSCSLPLLRSSGREPDLRSGDK